MGNRGFLALASALRRCASLEELDVDDRNQISDEVASLLVNSLPQSLCQLSLHGLTTSKLQDFT